MVSVLGVVGGRHAVDDVRLAVGGEVGVQLDHGGAGRDRVRAVDLNLVVVLCMGGGDDGREDENCEKAMVQKCAPVKGRD